MDVALEEATARAFRPSSYDDKPRNIGRKLGSLLDSFAEEAWARIDRMSQDERAELIEACLSVSPINCSWSAYKVAELVYHYAVQNAESDEPTCPTPNG